MTLVDILTNGVDRWTKDLSAKERFQQEGIVVFPNFLSAPAFDLLVREVERLSTFRRRREIVVPETGHTPRRMSTIGTSVILANSSLIPMIYHDARLISLLGALAGEPVFPSPDPNEAYVCNYLDQEGDTQGAHCDTYPFAFNFTIDSPEANDGGLLEWYETSAAWSSKRYLRFGRGDCYFLRTDSHLHSVTPLLIGQRRTVVNFAYANGATADQLSYSSGILYGNA